MDPAQEHWVGDCLAAITSKLCEYLRSASISPNPTVEILEESDISNGPTCLGKKRLPRPPDAVSLPASTTKRQKRSLIGGNMASDDEGEESEDGEEDEEGEGETRTGENEGSVNVNNKALVAAQRIAKKIESGIKKIRKVPVEEIEVWDGDQTVHDLAGRVEAKLWSQASEATTYGKEIRWVLRCLSSCFGLVRRELVAIDDHLTSGQTKAAVKSIRTKDRWRSAVYMINAIINGLYEHWGERTYLIYHALARKTQPDPRVLKRLSDTLTGMNYSMGDCSRMPRIKQQEIVTLVIEELRNFKMPDDVEIQQPILYPAEIITQTLRLE